MYDLKKKKKNSIPLNLHGLYGSCYELLGWFPLSDTETNQQCEVMR